jgi:hypothetical protein
VLVQLGMKVELKSIDPFFFCSCEIVHVIYEPKASREVVTPVLSHNHISHIDKKRKHVD